MTGCNERETSFLQLRVRDIEPRRKVEQEKLVKEDGHHLTMECDKRHEPHEKRVIVHAEVLLVAGNFFGLVWDVVGIGFGGRIGRLMVDWVGFGRGARSGRRTVFVLTGA